MIYELRTYWAAEGKLEDLQNRFRNVTLDIFARLNMTVVGFWTPVEATEDTGDLVYMMAFESEEAMKKAWDTFRVDPAWVSGHKASEVNGKLVTHLTSVVMNPTDYSPMK